MTFFIRYNYLIVLKFCIRLGMITAVLSAKFRNDNVTGRVVSRTFCNDMLNSLGQITGTPFTNMV